MPKLIKYLIISISVLIFLPVLASGFVSEMWPDEGRPIFRSKVDTVSLYERPSATSKVSEYKVKKNNIIIFDETCYQNVKSGKIKVVKTVSLNGRNFGRTNHLTHV